MVPSQLFPLTDRKAKAVDEAVAALLAGFRHLDVAGAPPDPKQLRSLVAKVAWTHRAASLSAETMILAIRQVLEQAGYESESLEPVSGAVVSSGTVLAWAMQEYFEARPFGR